MRAGSRARTHARPHARTRARTHTHARARARREALHPSPPAYKEMFQRVVAAGGRPLLVWLASSKEFDGLGRLCKVGPPARKGGAGRGGVGVWG